MSWTDDTEALLRFPPDAFLHNLESEQEPRENSFVKNLAKKIDSLHHRLDTLESVSFTDSTNFGTPSKSNNKSFSQSTPIKCKHNYDRRSSLINTFPRKKSNKYNKSDTIQRNKSNSLPRRAKNGRYNKIKINASDPHIKKNGFTLNQYDTSSDSLEGINYRDSSNMQSDTSSISTISPEKRKDNCMLDEIDKFLNKVSISEDKIMEDVRKSNENADGIVKQVDLDRLLAKYINIDYDNMNDLPKKSDDVVINSCNGLNDLNIEEPQCKNTKSSNNENDKLLNPIPTPVIDDKNNTSSIVSIEDTKKLDNKSSYSNITSNSKLSSIENMQKLPPNCNQDGTNSFLINPPSLPSLSRLWTMDTNKSDYVIDSQKFEEEKLRRQHCETMIQQLQKKLLEQQQKIAVAIEVDSAKEDIIKKLREVCSNTLQRIQSLELHHRNELQNLNTQIAKAHENVNNLSKICEIKSIELNKANNLIKEHEDKIKIIDTELVAVKKQCVFDTEEMKNILVEKEERIVELKSSNTLIVQLNKQLSDNLTLAQNSLDKMNEDDVIHNKQISDLKRLNKSLEDEIVSLKKEKKDLAKMIDDEKVNNLQLDGQKSKLQKTIDEAYKTIELLQSEFDQYKIAVQSQKNDLKDFYQKQVENIVSSKVNEFQNELDNAKTLMSKESQKMERDLAFHFAKHLQRVEQQHQNEIAVIEDKHKDQIKLYKMQMLKYNQTNQQLEEKLVSLKNKRGEIAAQLHNVMETQWQQALRIISNNGNSPEIAVKDDSDDLVRRVKMNKRDVKLQEPILDVDKKDDKLTNDKLQHYVKILLQKVPGLPEIVDPADQEQNQVKAKSVQFDGSSCNELEYPTSDKVNADDQRRMDKYQKMKPPWK